MNKPNGTKLFNKVPRSSLLILLSILLLLAVFAWDMPASEASSEANMSQTVKQTAFDDTINQNSSQEKRVSDILCSDQNYSDEEVIIKFKSSVSEKSADLMPTSLGSELETTPLLGDYVVADVPDGKSVEAFIDEISESAEIEYVQPNYIYQLNRAVNDPYLNQQWHLPQINAFDAWDITMGDAGIKVAVLDSCVDISHPDLSSQIILSWNALTEGSDMPEPDNHGTHVAGIIAAQANNSIGVTGVAPGIKLLVVNVFEGTSAKTTDVVKGIRYAVQNGARVINMSFGGYGKDKLMEDEVNAAVHKNVVVVAAAGNGATSSYSSPSDYDSVISVIATDQGNQKASFSDWGPYKDISAPGVNISSTIKNGAFGTMGGTSMASPIVAGVAALVLSVNPMLTVNEVKHILYNTAADVNTPGWDEYTGYGVVNAKAAVFAASKPTLSVSSVNTSTVSLAWSQITHAAGYEIFRAVTDSDSYAHIGTVSGVSSWTDSGLSGGTGYNYKVRAYYAEGAKTIYGTFSQAVSATTVYVTAPPTVAAPPPEPVPPTAPAPPTHVGIFAAKRIPSKANAGTAITVIPPAAPRGYTMQSVSYSSSNPSIATVDASGNVTFHAGGRSTIIIRTVSQTVDRRGRVRTKTTTAKKNITVNQPVEVISLNLADTTIARTQKVELTPVFAPTTASNKKVKWTSSNPKVAAVSSSGVVTGRAGGTALITCRALDGSGASASCSVTITPIYPTGLRLSKTALTIKAGRTSSLRATVAPRNTDFKTMTWTSSNPAIASVDARGRIRGASPGMVIITVTTSNGLNAACTVTIV